jgi:hypothetical protein
VSHFRSVSSCRDRNFATERSLSRSNAGCEDDDSGEAAIGAFKYQRKLRFARQPRSRSLLAPFPLLSGVLAFTTRLQPIAYQNCVAGIATIHIEMEEAVAFSMAVD